MVGRARAGIRVGRRPFREATAAPGPGAISQSPGLSLSPSIADAGGVLLRIVSDSDSGGQVP